MFSFSFSMKSNLEKPKGLTGDEFDFLALDVETANSFYGSICQIGIAKYKDGTVSEEWVSLVNPNDYFDPLNTGIHGIGESDVADSPTFADLHAFLAETLNGHITAHHTHFDKVAFRQACDSWDLPQISPIWLDTARVARRTWKDFEKSGYGLDNVCESLDIHFKHHHALEDAKASGEVLSRACQVKEATVEDWLTLVERPITQRGPRTRGDRSLAVIGDPDGPLFGESICFTGRLDTLVRRKAAQMAAAAGCSVEDRVTAKTTILVQGDQDILKARGAGSVSSKMKAALKLAKKGQAIRLLRETDFIELVSG